MRRYVQGLARRNGHSLWRRAPSGPALRRFDFPSNPSNDICLTNTNKLGKA